jgi:hypothetical protein
MTDEAAADRGPAPDAATMQDADNANPMPGASATDADSIAALRREWGADYDARMAGARRLAQEVATPELIAAVDRAGLGADPSFLRAVASLAERIYGTGDAAPAEEARLQERVDALHALQHHKEPARRAAYRSPAVQDELARLYAAIYGDGPVVGRGRRR